MRVSSFLETHPDALIAELALADARRFRGNEPQQIRAWEVSVACLRGALTGWDAAAEWELVLEFPMLRLGRRIDAILLTPRAILVLEFKAGATSFLADDRGQVEDYALDLQDFHSASRDVPIVPILIATAAVAGRVAWPLLFAGASRVLDASAASLPGLLRDLWARAPALDRALDPASWAAAPYRPVPSIVDAACTLYSRHGVADIRAARADVHNLGRTTEAILGAIDAAREGGLHHALFITGIPGAGKTLCGLNAVFGVGREGEAAFLTGNPTLVHVLREALARDAALGGGTSLDAARRKAETSIQALPGFRDHYIKHGDHLPAEHIIVVDEAQRAWSGAYAIAKSQAREVRLSDSEPGHLLDIMARRHDWAVVVCLIGNGQEIHDGEGGLAEWGAALRARPGWRVSAPPRALDDRVARQRLPDLPGLDREPALHLDIPVRSIRCAAASPWVDAVLAGDVALASHIAATSGPLPFVLTRDLAAMRAHLRQAARGLRRAGLLASSGARRLRADGLGAELPHMDKKAVANWFLDRWPDVRAADALEVVASEFSCQGLEIDFAGLCWGGDMIRRGGGMAWHARQFKGTAWQNTAAAEKIANRINTYRVLLTRARYETVIWVPRGATDDGTRPPREFDAVADFLRECGVPDMQSAAPVLPDAAPQFSLL